MDNNTMNTSNPSGMPMANNFDSPNKEKQVGPVIGLIIILAIILIGGVYFWVSKINQPVIAPANNTADSGQENAVVTPETIKNQSESDDPDSISADLNAFDSSDIDNLGSNL